MAAKSKTTRKKFIVKLVSSAGTGHYYTTLISKKCRDGNSKLAIKKFDPKVQKHVIYNQKKVK